MLVQKCAAAYLSQARRIWRHLPESWRAYPLGRAYGRHLHALVCRYSRRNQSHATFFLRNRPELGLLCRLLEDKPAGSSAELTVLACSKGAEVYSIALAVRSARPDLQLKINALDISREIVEFAQQGIYSLAGPAQAGQSSQDATWRDQPLAGEQLTSMFQRMSDSEVQAMFEIRGDQAWVRPWLKQNIRWLAGDANDAALAELLGPQDIVVANRFLCHMEPRDARACLRNLGRLVRPGGHLFVSGVDLNVRTEIARQMGWSPVTEMIREVHEGDASLREGWPLDYWGLEPFCMRRKDWQMRYASVFEVGRSQAAPAREPELTSR